jgi:hypothetical protein
LQAAKEAENKRKRDEKIAAMKARMAAQNRE